MVGICPLVAQAQELPAGESSAESAEAAGAGETGDLEAEIRALKELLRELSRERAEEMEELRQRIAELEEKLQQAEEGQQQEELEALMAEAEAATAEETQREQQAEAQRKRFVGRQRTLQAMNPEISFLGDVSYDWTDTEIRDQFLLRGVELGFQAPLDPYTRFKAFLGAHQELPELEHEHEEEPGADEEHGHEHSDHINLGVGEAYMEWVALPLKMRLRVGKFRQQFGTLNRWHIHALPSVDIPFALRNTFGHTGLVGLGVGADWRIPGPGTHSQTVTVEIVNADNPNAFAGSSFRDPSYLLRYASFFDLGPDDYFEIGLNGMTGPQDEAGYLDNDLASIDFNYIWEPVQRARYRGIELRGEYIYTRSEQDEDDEIESTSFYTYLSWRLGRRWIIGFRYDNAELPWSASELLHEQEFTEGLREKAFTPYLTFWQSEFVRLRLQYQHASRDFTAPHGPDDDDRVWVQVTFAAGPHKHEAY
jgi:hypothetical protein